MRTWRAVVFLVASALTCRAYADEAGIVRGEKVFNQWCLACHGRGADKPGTIGLAAKYNGSLPALLGERTDLTAEMVRYFVRHGFAMMTPFRKTEISDADLNDLCDYLTRTRR
jgi:mono/diheme cytochrome c family protein